jgi:hypothetical protein
MSLALQSYVKAKIKPGELRGATKHFYEFGYKEGRVPRDHRVDEEWYLATYSPFTPKPACTSPYSMPVSRPAPAMFGASIATRGFEIGSRYAGQLPQFWR